MEFYNVKTKQTVDIPESGLRKRTLVHKNGRQTYAVTAEEDVSKQHFDSLQVPEVEGS